MKPLFALLSLISLSLGTMSVAGQTPTKDQKPTITLGQVNLSFYAVVGGVVQELLGREGYRVEVIQGPHAEIFPRLGAGEVDIFAAAWLPQGHAALYALVNCNS
jgi:glycine betaine/proline transport system substrate-binding protein